MVNIDASLCPLKDGQYASQPFVIAVQSEENIIAFFVVKFWFNILYSL